MSSGGDEAEENAPAAAPRGQGNEKVIMRLRAGGPRPATRAGSEEARQVAAQGLPSSASAHLQVQPMG